MINIELTCSQIHTLIKFTPLINTSFVYPHPPPIFPLLLSQFQTTYLTHILTTPNTNLSDFPLLLSHRKAYFSILSLSPYTHTTNLSLTNPTFVLSPDPSPILSYRSRTESSTNRRYAPLFIIYSPSLLLGSVELKGNFIMIVAITEDCSHSHTRARRLVYFVRS